MSAAVYTELLRRPIAYHPVFRKVTGSTPAAVMVSQMYYWSTDGRISAEREGWFHKTIEQWEEETGLSRSEQNRARRDLLNAGVLEEVRKGNPARMWFRLKVDALLALVAQFAESCKLKSTASGQDGAAPSDDEKQPENINENNSVQNPANKNAESCKQDCTSQQSSMQNPANYLTETTTEITSETTCADAGASACSAPVIDHDSQPDCGATVGTEAEDPFLSNLFSSEPRETLPATTAAPTGAGNKFAMHFEWVPTEWFSERCRTAGVSLQRLEPAQQEEILGEFRSYWEARGDQATQAQWEHKLLRQLQRVTSSATGTIGVQPTRQQKRAVVTEAVMDIHDTTWGD